MEQDFQHVVEDPNQLEHLLQLSNHFEVHYSTIYLFFLFID